MANKGWHFGGHLLFFSILVLASLSHAGQKWTYHADAPIIGAPLIRDGTAYALSQSGSLFVIDMATGNQEYPYALPEKTSLPPVFGQKYLIIASDRGLVDAIDINAGKRVWRYGEGSPQAKSQPQTGILGATGAAENQIAEPTIVGGKANDTLLGLDSSSGLIFLSYADRLVALDEMQGREVWVRELGGGGSLASDSQAVYLAIGGNLTALSKRGGAPLWVSPSGYLFKTKPSVAESKGQVYVGTTHGQVVALDAKSGNAIWAYQTAGWVMSTPTQIGSLAVFGTNNGEVIALDASTGQERWIAKTNGPIWAQAAGAGENLQSMVVIGSNDRHLYAYDYDTGKQLWKYPMADWVGGGATADGRDFVVGTYGGEIYAISVSPMCTVSNLDSGQLVGEKFEVEGQAYAERGVGNVKVTVGRIEYPRMSGKTEWAVSVDASPMPDGPVDIRCTATDVTGLEEVDRAAKLAVVKSLSAPRQKMTLTLPSVAEPEKEIQAYVRGADGFDLSGVTVEIGGNATEAKSPVAIRAPVSDGAYKITVKKYGYDDAEGTLYVRSNNGPLLMLMAIAAVGFAAVVFLLLKVFGKK